MRRPLLFFLLSIAVTIGLYLVPYGRYVAYPLLLLSTFAHEMGHGLAALLVGGSFDSFEMAWDGSGVAHTRGTSGRFASAFVSAGGLVGPALAAAASFAVARRPRIVRLALWAASVSLVVCAVWVVRSLCGLVFVGALAAVCSVLARRGRDSVVRFAWVFVAVQLSLSVFSRGDYLFTPVARLANGAQPSDVAQMSDALFLPYWFWGAVCGAFSVIVLAVGVRHFLCGLAAESSRER